MTALGLQQVQFLMLLKNPDGGTNSFLQVCAIAPGLCKPQTCPSRMGRCPPRHESALLLMAPQRDGYRTCCFARKPSVGLAFLA